MPAEADLLCEHFISSNLKSRKKSNEPISAAAVLLKLNKNDRNAITTPTFSSSSTSFDSIDFVKYEKNPMDYLKSKYQLLNGSHTNNLPQQKLENKSNGQVTEEKVSLPAPTPAKVKSKPEQDMLPNMNWSRIKKHGTGLYNIGNNCYLNATLQCLAYTPPFSQWLVTKPHSVGCKLKRQKGFCSLCDVERIICDIFSCNGCAKPNSLCMNIKKISTVFGVGRQEDASEFFTTLIESMGKSINHLAASNGHLKQIIDAGKKRPTTILDDIFSFQFRSRVTCASCKRMSDTIENTNTWPIDVKHNNDIRKGMIQFLREEILDGHNAYKCDNCHKKTRATKKYSIRKAPNILVVHLKRFDFSVMGKLSHHVSYPETLNLKNLTQTPVSATSAGEDNKKGLKNSMYKLYGVLVHLGHSSRSGHYYSYVKGPNEAWFRADDSRVNKVQTSEAMSQKAYILFYHKIVENKIEEQNGQSKQPQLGLNGTGNNKREFNLNAKSPFLLNKLNGHSADTKVKSNDSLENGEKVSRDSLPSGTSKNLLNDLIASNVKLAKAKQAYSYSSPCNGKPAVTLNGTASIQNGLSNGDHKINGHENGSKIVPQENGISNGEPKENGKPNGEVNGHDSKHISVENETQKTNSPKEKLSRKKKVKCLTEKILALKAAIKENQESLKKTTIKELKLKKFIKRRKTLRKLIKKKANTNKELIEEFIKPATKAVFTNVKALMDEPLKIEKATSFADNNDKSKNALKLLKENTRTSTLKTWGEEDSELLVKPKKVQQPVKRSFNNDDGDLDGISVDSDEYNDDFDKPQNREKKPKFLNKDEEMNGFHKYTHGLNGRLKRKYDDYGNGEHTKSFNDKNRSWPNKTFNGNNKHNGGKFNKKGGGFENKFKNHRAGGGQNGHHNRKHSQSYNR